MFAARRAQEPSPLLGRRSSTRIAIERCFAERGIAIHPRLELSSNEAIKQAIRVGLKPAI